MIENINLLDLTESIAKKSKQLFEFGDTSNLNETIKRIDGLEEDIIKISEVANLSQLSVIFLSNLIYLELENEVSNLKYLGEHLGLGRFDLYKHKTYFEELKDKKFIKYEINKIKSYEVYILHETITAFTINDISSLKRELIIDINTFFEKLNYLNERFMAGYLTADNVEQDFNTILETFATLDLVKKIKNFNITEACELLILCFVLSDHINYKNRFDWKGFIKAYHVTPIKVLNSVKKFMDKKTDLFKMRLIEFNNTYYDDRNNYIKLTEYASDIILGAEACFAKQDFIPKHCTLIETASLENKKLFFNKSFESKFNTLTQVLNTDNFNKLIEKFSLLNMPASITVILHGKPGTGKTESVYQIAKETNRQILSVNLASIKDKFVGESERRMQELFNNYRSAINHFEQSPILLFNEADAILSNRIQSNSSVDMMNNTLQNILLQEIEDFKGILIATTNNIHNIDKAFDRRFLYKLNYEKPNKDTSMRIWQSLLPIFTDIELLNLSENYNLTGGQIQNVFKKLNTDTLLFNSDITLNKVIEYCEEETSFRTKKYKIGF